MIEIGKVNDLVMNRETKSGFYLIDVETDEEVFMPPSMAPMEMNSGMPIKAFVYVDPKGDLIATKDIPNAQVGEYALMKVLEVQDFGAFLDWGIDKDLLIPGNEQKFEMNEFEDHLVRVCLEPETDRVFATTKLSAYIENTVFDLEEGDNIAMQAFQQNDLGYNVIVNKKFIGMIYHNEIYKNIEIGETYQGVAKKLREDGLIDCSLQVLGIKNVVDSKDVVLDVLTQNGGSTSVYDKSSPEEIRGMFNMSKKTFKAACGMLYKERLITISKDGISLVSKK